MVKAFLVLSLWVTRCKACDKYISMWVYMYMCVCVCESLSCVQLFATPWTPACQVLLSMEFSRQEYWSGLPFSSPGGLPRDWIWGSCIAGRLFSVKPPGKSYMYMCVQVNNKSPVFCPEWYLKPVSLLFSFHPSLHPSSFCLLLSLNIIWWWCPAVT